MNTIDCEKEIKKITDFLQNVFQETGIGHVVIAWSGGIDSTTCLFLLRKVLRPEQITVLHLPYSASHTQEFDVIQKQLQLPTQNIHEIFIRSSVDALCDVLSMQTEDIVRKGNIMARVRMIVTYDYAKKNNALVCGTENKTENLLGYYTRFGDEASDIEPIKHLYKTEVYQLARDLSVPDLFLKKKPTAELWKGQTDEGEFGFAYAEADNVLRRYYEKKESIEVIETEWKNAQRIIAFCKKNEFKKKVPYCLYPE